MMEISFLAAMTLAQALEKFTFASWRVMVAKEGNIEKVFSPYSAFVSMLMTALLPMGETKRAELLAALQIGEDSDVNVIAEQLAHLLSESEYPLPIYNASFDKVLALLASSYEVDVRRMTDTQKVWLYLFARNAFGGDDGIDALIERVKTERDQGVPDGMSYHKDVNTEEWSKTASCQFRTLVKKAKETIWNPFVIAGANRLWPNQRASLPMSYFSILTDRLGIPVTPVELPEPGVSQINHAIQETTHGLIKDLLDSESIDKETDCILTNAIYFKAKWYKLRYEDPKSEPATWKKLDGSMKEIGLMYGCPDAPVLDVPGATLVALKYYGSGYSMILALPDELGEAAFNQLVGSITSEMLAAVSSAPCVTVSIRIPRFQTKWGTNSLKEMFTTLGVSEMFTRNVDGELMVNDILQQAFIKVTEEGTEAAAATSVEFSHLGLCHFKKRLVCDHPFMYFIRNDMNGAILFIGSCVDPQE